MTTSPGHGLARTRRQGPPAVVRALVRCRHRAYELHAHERTTVPVLWSTPS